MTEAVSFKGLGHAYRPDLWVLRGYTASVCKGHIMALLGPNGRGKTTLLKLLLGLLRPTEGEVSVAGVMAFVPQLFQISFDYTTLDIVLMGRARRIGLFAQPSAKDAAAARASLDRFGIADLADRSFHELSGGQRQLVIFARALCAEADVLILDEPTASLDLNNQGLVLQWIDHLAHKDGLTILFTTHDPRHALAIADDALLMFGPDRFFCGPALIALTEEHLGALYGVEMRLISFEHAGRLIKTFVPVLGVER